MKYAAEKPTECTECTYYDKSRKKCVLEACYFLLEEPQKASSPCEGCPYGKGREFCFPCLKKIIKNNQKEGKNGEWQY